MKKLLLSMLVIFSLTGPIAAQTSQSDIRGMRMLGNAVATEFGRWSNPATSQVAASGSRSVTLAFSSMNAPDGTGIPFLTTHTPLLITGDGNIETVTPSVVSCSPNSGICSFTATFGSAHPNNFRISSGTYGLQEAIDSQSVTGGMVVVPPDWLGTTTMIQNATGATSVGIWDMRSAGVNFYVWNGSHYIVGWGVNANGGLTPSTITSVANINNIRYCPVFNGSNAGAQLAACIANLPATAGIAVASFEGNQTITQDIFAGATGSGELRICGANFSSSVSQNIPRNWRIIGCGREVGGFTFTNTGDGFKSTWNVNSSTAVNIVMQDFYVKNTNGSNAGAGFVDLGGTFVELHNVYFSGWKWGTIFDQTEISTINHCDYEMGSLAIAGVWLVNGPAHTMGANYFFTNQISITNHNQFNATAGSPIAIQDDGGVSHIITNNNFNGSGFTTHSYTGAGVSGLIFSGNEIEGGASSSLFLTSTISGGGIVGQVTAPVIEGNYLADGVASAIDVDFASGGKISGNTCKGMTVSCVVFSGGAANKSTQVEVSGNSKLISGGFQTTGAFVSGDASVLKNNIIRQQAHTFVVASQFAGSQTVTPTTMEGIYLGEVLLVQNLDGTNLERVDIRGITGSTFTATFATAKAANWVIFGTGNQNESPWTPTLAGTTGVGANTYTLQIGTAVKDGTKVQLQGRLTVTVLDAAMTGNIIVTLPYAADNIPNNGASCLISAWDGMTLTANYTQVTGRIQATENFIRLVSMGSGQTALYVTKAMLAAPVDLDFQCSYFAVP